MGFSSDGHISLRGPGSAAVVFESTQRKHEVGRTEMRDLGDNLSCHQVHHQKTAITAACCRMGWCLRRLSTTDTLYQSFFEMRGSLANLIQKGDPELVHRLKQCQLAFKRMVCFCTLVSSLSFLSSRPIS